MDLKHAGYELRAEFARHAMLDRNERERRYNAELRRRIESPEDRRRKQEQIENIAAALATPAQIESFKVRLDAYDTATVEALMNNERQFRDVRERIQTMLLEAHVLPDGRRVFRTRDGKQMFDEHGQEVSPDVLKADAIDPGKPAWEDYRLERAEEVRLVEERQQLQEYQQKLDDTRTKVDDGSLSKGDLDELDADLQKSMPKAVRDVVQRNEAQRTQANRDSPTPATPDSSRIMVRDGGTAPPLPAGMR